MMNGQRLTITIEFDKFLNKEEDNYLIKWFDNSTKWVNVLTVQYEGTQGLDKELDRINELEGVKSFTIKVW